MKTYLLASFCMVPLFFITGCGSGPEGNEPSNIQDTPASEINDLVFEDTCPSPEIPIYTGDSKFTISPVTATYYREVDNFNSGIGTNGSDPNIVPEFVYQEMITETSINYTWSDFQNLDSEQLFLTWEGEIDVESESANILASFNSSYADITFYIDGEVVARLNQCDKQIPLILSAGKHSFRIEYHNHYFSTGLFVSFLDIPIKNSGELRVDLSTIIEPTNEVVYLYTYNTDNFDGTLEVTLPESDNDLILILNSHNPIHWKIKNYQAVKIKSVVIGGYGKGSHIDNMDNVIILDKMPNEPELIGDLVREVTGKNITYGHEIHSGSEILVTEDDKLGTGLRYGSKRVIVNNLQGVELSTLVSESNVDRQIISTFMRIEENTILTFLKWTVWSDIVIEDNGSHFETQVDQDFSIKVYSGEFYPEALVSSRRVTVRPSKLYTTEVGKVYSASSELDHAIDALDQTIELTAGNYWISIQYHTKEEGVHYRNIIEADGINEGGAFSLDGGITWGATTEGLTPRSSAGTSLYVEGYLTHTE